MTTRMHEVYGWNQGSEACTELFLVHVLCFERECMCARASDGRCVTFLFFFETTIRTYTLVSYFHTQTCEQQART